MQAINEDLALLSQANVLNARKNSLEEGAPSAAEHYALHLFAGIHCLLAYMHHLSTLGGETLEQYYVRYPFLKAYYQQILLVVPGKLSWSDGKKWWQSKLKTLTAGTSSHLPLKVLGEQGDVDHQCLLALMLVGLVEEDSRFGTLFAELQQPLGFRRPMLETLAHIVIGAEVVHERSPWEICRPLIVNHLIQVEDNQLPRSEWVLKMHAAVWDAIRSGTMPAHPSHFRYIPFIEFETLQTLLVDPDLQQRLQGIPALLRQGCVRHLVLRAPEGSHSVAVSGAVARALDKNLLVIPVTEERSTKDLDAIGMLCTLTNTIPVYQYELGPGETVQMPVPAGYHGPVIIILGVTGGLDIAADDQMINLNLDFPNRVQRKALWLKYLRGNPVDGIDAIARQFRIPGEYIRQIAQITLNNAALAEKPRVSITDIREAARNLNRQKLDSLADRLEARGSWSQLITAATTSEKLLELEQRCHYREQLLNHLGPAFKNSSNCGVRALFTGRSGTGKTLAARILAAELGMDIYRVDLASIVNKYIGETEKNLNKVLTRAEALDVVLLLDEGDALLGQRTEVKNANDRYANLETNYLLQRLEHYQGIILVTTNLSDSIDKAFQRRMDIVIPFFQPQLEQRLSIFYLHLPEDHQVSDVFLEKVATYCTLMGGQIRNICMHASLLALDENSVVKDAHLDYALRSEYRKNGGTYPLNKHQSANANDGGISTFVNALSRRN